MGAPAWRAVACRGVHAAIADDRETLTMCGRFSLTEQNRERVAEQLGVPADQLTPDSYTARWNIAPTDLRWSVRMKREEPASVTDRWAAATTALLMQLNSEWSFDFEPPYGITRLARP